MSRISITFIFKVFLTILVLFNMTTLKFSLGLTSISFLFNAFLFLLASFVILHGIAFFRGSPWSAMIFFLVIFLCFSATLNLYFNLSFVAAMQLSTYLLPWLALIMVLFNRKISLRDYKFYWSWFNTFFFIIILIGMGEYLATQTLGYRPPIMKLDTGMGEYYVGYSTLFQKIPGDYRPYYRFQGPFGESGDLAMWSSVLLIYNLIRQKYVYAFVFVSAIFFSFSPSVYISLFVAFLIYIRSRPASMMPIIMLFICVIISIFLNDIISIYHNIMEAKVTSLSSRIGSTFDFIYKFPFLINTYPFGVPFFESADEQSASEVGFSITYGPIGSYMKGGLIAFLVYIVIVFYGLVLSGYKILLLKGGVMENELYIYYLMLFTYIVQRFTLMDYAIFPFLFAPLFFGAMATKNSHNKLHEIEKLG